MSQQQTQTAQRTLFLCSHMAPFGAEGLRQELRESIGDHQPFKLHVENQILVQNDDARPPCARAIQACDGVIVLLDGTPSLLQGSLDAAVLELEIMIAAACAKPVLVIDASEGTDPILNILGTEFFHRGRVGDLTIKSITGNSHDEKIAQIKKLLEEICAGDYLSCESFDQRIGWEKLFLSRPDRLQSVSDDGGNFPFSQSGMQGLLSEDLNMMSSDISAKLDRADQLYQTDKMAAIVHAWDAIRVLSIKPWGNVHHDKDIALLWLRALKIWGGSMSWLGVFGHSSGAAIMATLAGARISSRLETKEIENADSFAMHGYYGGLASTYYSLSKLAITSSTKTQMLRNGTQYATDALKSTDDSKARAGILAVRGPLRLLAGTRGVIGGFMDLHESVRLHRRADNGNYPNYGLACAQIQLGAAYKELAKRTLNNSLALKNAYRNLQHAHESLEESNAEIGQLLMCKKHLVETFSLLGQDDEAHILWKASVKLAHDKGVVDQHRQLLELAKTANWINEEV